MSYETLTTTVSTIGLTRITPNLVPFLALSSVLHTVGLLIPSASIRRIFLICMVAIDTYFVVFTTTGSPWSDHHLGNACASRAFLACDFLILSNAQRDFSRIGEQKYHDLPWWKRLLWAVDLSNNVRGIGWNWEAVKAHPPHPSDSTGRIRFVLRQLLRWAVAQVMMDATMTIFRKRPACHIGGSFLQDGLAWQAIYVAAWYLNLCFAMILSHSAVAGASVALGISKPSDWPNLYGGIQHAYSMRRFWGRAWHHLFRRFLTSHAQFFTRRVLGMNKGNRLQPYLELYIAFFLSGVVHWIGTYAMLRRFDAPNLTVLFFILQATAITLEDGVVALGTRLGIRDGWTTRLAGYVWVAAWMVLLTPIRTEPLVKIGYFDQGDRKQFSIVQGLLEGQWYPGYERAGLAS